jgi:endogenous inhibitor of DNA gyrase (YacG/DUF329 family)
MADLGRWLQGDYRIPEPARDPADPIEPAGRDEHDE